MYFFQPNYLDFFHLIGYSKYRNIKTQEVFRMHVIDKDTCIGCGACEGTWPVSAISADANGKYEIGEACVDCGACAGVCPVSAITA